VSKSISGLTLTKMDRVIITCAAVAVSLVRPADAGFNISNTLGSGMVLQRAPQAAVVWGFGDAGE